jgi:DNA polymerase elongation subunit (family B)
MSQIKRLFFDIETSPNIGLFWTAGYRLSISPDNIIKERAIICICYKWAGDDKVYSLSWDKNQDDKKLLEQFIKVANEADELIGHNGDRFDLPWVRTRCLYHRIPVFPTYTTLDTLKNARSKFKFNSNKLDYIAKFLGIGAKIKTGYDLWKKVVLDKDQEALDSMVEYCKNDVLILEQVYNEMSSYIPAKTHHGVANGGERYSCPKCASEDMKFSQKRYTASGTPRIQLQCKNCHTYHTVSSRIYETKLASDTI